MTRPDLDALSALAEKATPGPWHQGREGNGYESTRDVYFGREPDSERSLDIATYIWSDKDAALIAASRDAIPALIAYAREREERVRELEGRIEKALTVDHSEWDSEKIINGMRIALLTPTEGATP
jgi:hypothetical protein